MVAPPTESVDGLGWTIIPPSETTDYVFDRIVTAWKLVASYGRWCDKELGEWPSADKIEEELPAWMTPRRFSEYNFGFPEWCGDIQEREWIWWWGRRCDSGEIRIDIKAFAMPISDWTIRAVIQLAGGEIAYRDVYRKDIPGPDP